MLIKEFFENPMTQTTDGWISMTDAEWVAFQALTKATFRPRSVAEFNALCDLAAAVYLTDLRADPTANCLNGLHAVHAETIKVSPDGRINFPRPVAATSAQEDGLAERNGASRGLRLVQSLPAAGASHPAEQPSSNAPLAVATNES